MATNESRMKLLWELAREYAFHHIDEKAKEILMKHPEFIEMQEDLQRREGQSDLQEHAHVAQLSRTQSAPPQTAHRLQPEIYLRQVRRDHGGYRELQEMRGQHPARQQASFWGRKMSRDFDLHITYELPCKGGFGCPCGEHKSPTDAEKVKLLQKELERLTGVKWQRSPGRETLLKEFEGRRRYHEKDKKKPEPVCADCGASMKVLSIKGACARCGNTRTR